MPKLLLGIIIILGQTVSASEIALTYYAAIEHCAQNGGHLPSAQDFAQLARASKNINGSQYWTASLSSPKGDSAYVFDGVQGLLTTDKLTSKHMVFCAKGRRYVETSDRSP